ncbi:MAG: hypothetical protein NVS2B8_16610 [Vulcanimicrobiaceae bacterium]
MVASLAPEAVMTFDVPDGFTLVHSLGDVRAQAIVPRNFIRATFRTIGTLIGLSPTEVLTDAERGRNEALDTLLGIAGEVGANAVLALRFEAYENPDGSTLVAASGEAVILDPAPAPTRARGA